MREEFLSFEELRKNALVVQNGMYIKHVLTGEVSTISLDDPSQHEGHFCMNNGVLSFIKEGLQYVTPYRSDYWQFLKQENGFKEKCFRIPMSVDPAYEEPVFHGNAKKWRRLRTIAETYRAQKCKDDCVKFCKQHGVTEELPEDFLKRVIVVPQCGISTNHGRIYAVVHGLVDSYVQSWLGKFAEKNGVVYFVTPDGRTCITPDTGVVTVLKSLGYTRKNPEVKIPMTEKGDEISEPEFKSEWDKLSA